MWQTGPVWCRLDRTSTDASPWLPVTVEAVGAASHATADQRVRVERVTRVAAMALTFATDAEMEAATEAVQIHGARGYSEDYPVERYLRVAKGMQIYEGTNGINRLVVARRLYE